MTLHERLDTRVNVQNLLSALVIAGGLVAWGMRIDSRVTALEGNAAAQKSLDDRQDLEANRRQDQANTQFQVLNAKLDRLIERR